MADEVSEAIQRHKEEQALTDKADAIIQQPVYTDEDIRLLHKIKREMTKLYAKTVDIATCTEHNFELVENTLADWPVTAQKVKSRQQAEEQFGSFRNFKAVAQGIYAKIKAIESICIQWNVERKGEYSAAMTQEE